MLHHIQRVSIAVVLLANLYSFPIHADADKVDDTEIKVLCSDVNMKAWGSREKILKKVEAMGLKPFQVKVEKGCWQVDALNRNKQKVEIYIHPVSGKTVMRKIKPKSVILPPSHNSN